MTLETANFGPSYSGLSTVGYTTMTLVDGAWVSADRVAVGSDAELAAGSGIYAADVTATAPYVTLWDTGQEDATAYLTNVTNAGYADGAVNANATIDPAVLADAIETAITAADIPADVWTNPTRTLTSPAPVAANPNQPFGTSIVFGAGDTLPVIQATITDAGGNPVSLVGASVKAYIAPAPGYTNNPTISGAADIISPATSGQVSFSPEVGALLAGEYNAQFVVSWPASGEATSQMSWPQNGYIDITVEGSLINS